MKPEYMFFLIVFLITVVVYISIRKNNPNKAASKSSTLVKTNELDIDFILDIPNKPQPQPQPKLTPELEVKKYDREYDSFDYEDYDKGHTENTWKEIGFAVKSKHRSNYRRYYSVDQVEVGRSSKYLHLTPNQRKVKILGDALVYRTGSKYRAKEILVNQYGFRENTAKYAAGYDGYHDW